MLLPENESQRLEVLNQYQILDTPPEELFDELAQLAANFCETPIALISLIDAEREWFKSKIGLTIPEISRSISFSSYTILESQILIIPNTLEDERVAKNPLVISNHYFRFYAGVPLINSSGFALGSLCVIDFIPRTLTVKEQVVLQQLGRQVMRYLELHRQKVIDDTHNSFHFLFYKNPNPMLLYQENNLQLLDVNEAAVAHYGYSKEEFLQMGITDIHFSEDTTILRENLKQEYKNFYFYKQCQHRRKDGQIIDVEIVGYVIKCNSSNARLVNIRDITEYKRIERILQESEARFKVISEAIPIPLIISRLSDGLILYANSEFMQTFRFSSEDLVNRKNLDLYHNSTDLEFILEALHQHDSLQDYELKLKRSDGTDFWAIASLQYLSFNGESAILTVFYDITNRKNVEVKLQEQNEFLRKIFESIPLMIALIDANGKLQWVNKEWESVLGWKFKDFQTSDVLEALYPNTEYRQYVIDFMQNAQRNWGDFKIQVRDGDLLDTSWTNVKLSNGQIIGIGQDITERKRTELALKAQAEREQLMRTVAQRIRQSLNLQDILNATVQEVRHLLGVDRVIVYQFDSEMIGTIVAESVESGWTASLGVEIHDTCFQTGAGVEYYQRRKRAIANIYEAGLTDCHIRLLEQFEVKANLVVPILLEVSSQNPGSHLWGLLIAHQCSSFREWEENQLDLLDQLTVQLAIAIQQSSIFEQAQTELVQRQKAQVKLKHALAEKEVLLKEVHHRVKNNLQIVSSLLQLQSQTLKDPEAIKVLRESQNRIESISLIHKNLYTSANIGQIDVSDYIHNLAASLLISYQIWPDKISLETDIDSVSLNVDQAIACGLVINELISNALKHAFPNQKAGKISISLRNIGKNIEMTVRDNGIGLPDNLDWTNTDSLGLSLVYDLVTEQLEGDITLERNHGTVFKIQFTQLTLHQ
ncbi:MAG: PAS domain S-box protein [Nostoc sp. DedVER02]|uniref:PAS domain S-box protein n=1 Tax=unclassified Nostoc TaxID=2593658 RepID=UPI002AD25530|nr:MULTISPECIES: PAS domain S-box protein [unclassified Nostoc]MDZ7985284.1 PAS domain S-box protein [Nostoc sp. DedVER02]MDZ8115222.1 PAS domain S-box protein [Nostoc sp. DedVER01b]